jgi:hypothetical protein
VANEPPELEVPPVLWLLVVDWVHAEANAAKARHPNHAVIVE